MNSNEINDLTFKSDRLLGRRAHHDVAPLGMLPVLGEHVGTDRNNLEPPRAGVSRSCARPALSPRRSAGASVWSALISNGSRTVKASSASPSTPSIRPT